MSKHIVIAGNIGAGKSTFVEKLCTSMNWNPYYEPVSTNPYLEDFYKDMTKWSFHSQLFFLSDRMSMHKELQAVKGYVVQDRSIYEDAEIFAKNLYNKQYMTGRDFNTYWKMYSIAINLLNPPDLVIYLKASLPLLKDRIQKRNRDYELTIRDDYLTDLNLLYANWINNWTISPLIVLNIDQYDLLMENNDLDLIVEKINNALNAGQGELF